MLFALKHTGTPYLRSPLWKWLQTLRGVRIINVLVGLFFSVHLLACGWYMCASLHANVQVPNGAKVGQWFRDGQGSIWSYRVVSRLTADKYLARLFQMLAVLSPDPSFLCIPIPIQFALARTHG